MKQDQFDLMLMDEISALPPDEPDMQGVTPWKEAICKIMWGMSLTTFKLEFFYLQYLLPLLGSVLMYLGYRSLRQENKWFKLCWLLSAARLIWHAAWDVLYATPLPHAVEQASYFFPVAVLLSSVGTLQLLLLRAAIRTAFAATGEKKPTDWLGWGVAADLTGIGIAVWCELVPLTEPSFLGMDIIDEWAWLYYGRSFVFLALEIFLLVCIARQSRALAGRGYDIRPIPVRFPAPVILVGVFGAVLLCIPAALYIGSHVPNGPVKEVATPLTGEALIIRDRLVELGMPQKLADCLDEEELALCQTAIAVKAPTSIYSCPAAEDGYPVEGNFTRDPLGDGEASISSWAVLFPDGATRYYHFFQYLSLPSLRLQEEFYADPAGNHHTNQYAARLLWEAEGRTYTVQPQIQLSGGQTAEELTEDAQWWYEHELNRLGHLHYAPRFAFSIPRDAETMRGYLAFTAETKLELQFNDFCRVHLRHQNQFFQYPFRSISSVSSRDGLIQSNTASCDFYGMMDEYANEAPAD